MATTQTYSFLDVQCTIAGPGGSFPLGNSAGASKEGITVTMDEAKNFKTMGADGSGQNSLRASNAGKVTIRLLKTSPTNALLSQLYNFQKTSSAVWGQNTLVVTDIARGDVAAAQGVAFAKQPNLVYAEDANVNDWEFDCIEVDQLLGIGAPSAQ